MQKKTLIIIVSVLAAAVVAAGLGVLIWWLLWDTEVTTINRCMPVGTFTLVMVLVIELEGEGVGTASYTAAFTRIRNVGDMFWWFYPTTSAAATSKPLLLWLDGVMGLPPSLLANFGMIGPYDFDLNPRANSWIDEFNLLFVDSPIGTGFSVPTGNTNFPTNLEENADHLVHTLNSFYSLHKEYRDTPLYIIGQGSGAQHALQLAIRLDSGVEFSHNLHGVVLGNGIISPALALTKLGFYLEEMGYIDYVGRAAIQNYTNELISLVNQERYADAFELFLSLDDYVNTAGETVAVNLGHIIEKLTRTPATSARAPDFFGQKKYLRNLFPTDFFRFMDETVAPLLGFSPDTEYDDSRLKTVDNIRETFMIPAVAKVEYILQNTQLNVAIYNGNLDAVSNTPGQLEWVNNLHWDRQEEFRNSSRETLVVNRLVEGYFRETRRLQFYWINAAGHWTPIDSPTAMRRVIQRITQS